jgi:hypothetical protein
MSNPSVKQFKLTNGDEIICEVLQWDTEDEAGLIIRAVLKLILGEDPDKNLRFYTFRPWMGFVTDPNDLHTLNSQHILGEVTPTKELKKLWSQTIHKMLAASDDKRVHFNVDDFNDMDDDEVNDYIIDRLREQDEDFDENVSDNIIQFKPKTTLH